MLSLTLALRAAAILLLLMIAFGYLNSGELQIKQFIAANVLFILSVFGDNNQKRIAIISLLLAIIILVGTIQTHMAGQTTVVVAVVNSVIFIYLAIVAARSIKSSKKLD